MEVLRIVCRDSALGVAQVHQLIDVLRVDHPDIVPELIKMSGDSAKDGENAHLAAMETALEDGDADLSVHSLEELPASLWAHLPIVALSERQSIKDALVIAADRSLPDLEKPLGAKGAARQMQLSKIYPGWRIEPVAGTIDEQLEMLDAGELGALALAEADLVMIGMKDRIHIAFSESQVIPAPGQGIVAVRGRAGDRLGYLAKYHSVGSWYMYMAERSFCDVFAGGEVEQITSVRAGVRGDKVMLNGMIVDQNGKIWEGSISGKREDAVQLGTALAARLALDAKGPKGYKIAKRISGIEKSF
ncbi:MAG: hypothetical protein FWE32_12150 [Oscillospiraceae bacterium]|nr:hypothetical protein [Oscillospiraceae bacterium]